MWSGLVPQHSPSKPTPAATQPSASATKSAGGMTSTKFQFGSVKYPDSGVHGCFRHQVLVTRTYPHAIKAINARLGRERGWTISKWTTSY